MKHNKQNPRFELLFFFALSASALSGCGMFGDFDANDNGLTEPTIDQIDYSKRGSFFGKGGLDTLLKGSDATQKGGGIGVNSYLWRASLDTIAFMPVNSADPFGGVIITDWYAPKEAPNERFKLNVYILDKTLRADGIRVAAFRQVQDRLGNWIDAAIPDEAGTKIEDSILVRARQLRNLSKNQ
jgi:hypothetical protein